MTEKVRHAYDTAANIRFAARLADEHIFDHWLANQHLLVRRFSKMFLL